MQMLGKHQDIQARVYQEQLDILGPSLSKTATMEDLDKMKLLDRVIKESLRMFPNVPFISRKIMEDRTVGQFFISKQVLE